MLKFNVTGPCVPKEDYMVDISGMIEQIRKLVDDRCYFTINCARQYGKTTTLLCLKKALADDYLVASISFEGVGDSDFESEESFCRMFLDLVGSALGPTSAPCEYTESRLDPEVTTFRGLSKHITKMCKPDASFNPSEIATMLTENEADHNSGMDIPAIAGEIYAYTSGYPFFVSRICQCIDEELGTDWTLSGVQDAVKIILDENNVVFNDIYRNLENDQDLYDFIYGLLVTGNGYGFEIYNPIIDLGYTYGFLERGKYNRAMVTNRIFEILMYNYFISKDTR